MKTFKYILGIFFALGGIGMLGQFQVISGLLIFILGIILLPPISEQLNDKFSFWKNKGIRYIVYILLFGIAGIFNIQNTVKKSEKKGIHSDKTIVEYIKKDTLDKSLRNLRELVTIGEYFGIKNSSFRNIKKHITQRYDSIENQVVFEFNPKLVFENKEENYLKKDQKKGLLKDYRIEFLVNDLDEIIAKKTIITYSKVGSIEYENDDVPSLDHLVTMKVVESQKEYMTIKQEGERQVEARKKRKEEFESKCISSWDGAHSELLVYVKRHMNDRKSFEHVETKYTLYDDYVLVMMKFRGKNGLGAMVLNQIRAKVGYNCEVLEIVD
ncbi:hypothetical protein ACPDHL_03425 [Myroides sp. C15-4]|uniref:hypothetical protein n=1 Tax=Myroides sp. C15-4 TaxID=3400532 RepID=UPI003D2F84CB